MNKELLESTIQDAIKDFEFNSESQDIGKVISVYDGIANIAGLTDVMMDEMVVFEPSNLKGNVIVINESYISILVLGDCKKISVGDEVKRTKQFFSIKVSDSILGKTLNGFGEPIDDSEPINKGVDMLVDADAIPMIDRDPVTKQLVTGVTIIDCAIPIGLGQRELIVGDMNTGKSTLGLTAILNNKDNPDYVFIYVAIGQKINHCSKLIDFFNKNNVKNFVIIRANCSDPSSMRYYAPMVGTAIGEYFRDTKRHAVIIYDNLNAHAIAYREISLILKRAPGREAYPGDIFYQHAKLLERACQLNKFKGGGSLTALPIVESFGGDISSYISTNIISITDGQIILTQEEFAKNFRPAIKTGISVSRVGSNCQYPIIKKLAGSMKIQLAQYEEYVELTKFSSSTTEDIKKILNKGHLIKECLQQDIAPVPLWKQALILYGLKHDLFKNKEELGEFYNFINSLSQKEKEIISGNEESISKALEGFLNAKYS